MDIVIDKENIKFTLEGEEKISEVITEINNWLRNNERIVTNVSIQNQDDQADVRDWNDILVNDVKILNIESLHNYEFRLASLRLLQNYILELQTAQEEKNQDELKRLKRQEHEVQALLATVISEHDARNIIAHLDDNSTSDDTHFINNFMELLREQEREIIAPLQECMLTAGILSRELDSFREIPVLVQTGKGAEAMQMLVRFSNLTVKILRIYPYLIFHYETKQKSIEMPVEEINKMLNELADALEKKDMVNAGDVLEYELIPVIEDWISVFYGEFNDTESET